MGSRVSGIREGEDVFLSYLNDDGQIISGFVYLVSLTDTLLTFQTNQNTVTIPVSRMLKIKQRDR